MKYQFALLGLVISAVSFLFASYEISEAIPENILIRFIAVGFSFLLLVFLVQALDKKSDS